MLLQDLDALYDSLSNGGEIDPIGFKSVPVRFVVELDAAGRCVGITDSGGDREQRRLCPETGRSGTQPLAFAATDNAQFVLGVAKKAGGAAAGLSAHRRFLARLDEASHAVSSIDPDCAAQLEAISAFLIDRDSAIAEFVAAGERFELDAKGDCKAANDRIAFRVDGADPTSSPAFRDWWATVVSADLGSGDVATCQVSGRAGALARKMPGIQVVPGTPQALVSANFKAAERYGAQQSGGAHLAVSTAIRSHQALNWLLRDPHHHRRVGELTFVWWLDGHKSFSGLDLFVQPNPDAVRDLIASPWTSRPGMRADLRFRCLALSLNEARVVIRMDHDTTLGQLQSRLDRWLALLGQDGRDGMWWPSIWNLAETAVPPGEGTARRARKDRAIDALARTALLGSPLPRSLLSAAVDRCRAQPWPGLKPTQSHSRAALLRLCRHLAEDSMPDPVGDACGRLLAQLESAQHAAMPDLNKTVVDRFYAAASVNPERVFPGLMRDVNAHLRKAGRNGRRGAEIAISRRIGELAGRIIAAGGFPPTLTLEGQADFALGYWDERQSRFTNSSTDSATSADKYQEEDQS